MFRAPDCLALKSKYRCCRYTPSGHAGCTTFDAENNSVQSTNNIERPFGESCAERSTTTKALTEGGLVLADFTGEYILQAIEMMFINQIVITWPTLSSPSHRKHDLIVALFSNPLDILLVLPESHYVINNG